MPTARTATAQNFWSPRPFFAIPATLEMTMRPAPAPMTYMTQRSQNRPVLSISLGFTFTAGALAVTSDVTFFSSSP